MVMNGLQRDCLKPRRALSLLLKAMRYTVEPKQNLVSDAIVELRI